MMHHDCVRACAYGLSYVECLATLGAAVLFLTKDHITFSRNLHSLSTVDMCMVNSAVLHSASVKCDIGPLFGRYPRSGYYTRHDTGEVAREVRSS